MKHEQLPFRRPTDAYRLEAMGFHMAEQVITSDAQAREVRDDVFRWDLVPLRDFLRPYVFSGSTARDLACHSPMPGGVFALEPTRAEELSFYWTSPCLFAIGHGIDDSGFEEVASAIAGPEMASLVERCGWTGTLGSTFRADSVVLSVSGALYQLLVDEDGEPEVRAKAPFGVVSDDEVERTASWLLERLVARLEEGATSDV